MPHRLAPRIPDVRDESARSIVPCSGCTIPIENKHQQLHYKSLHNIKRGTLIQRNTYIYIERRRMVRGVSVGERAQEQKTGSDLKLQA
jgi:hypothetical protein